MSKTFNKDEFKCWSNEELLEHTKGRAVTFYKYDKTMTQLCANDLMGFNAIESFYFTHTGINIEQKDVEFLEIIE